MRGLKASYITRRSDLFRRNYKYISQKQLIAELAVCEAGAAEAIKEERRRRLEQMSQYDWVSRLLLGED